MMPFNMASAFVGMLGEPCTFQTFDDTGAGRRNLSLILHGTLAEHVGTLTELNARGAGVFVMVAQGDGKGRKGANVRRVRAAFVDLDGAPLEPIRGATLAPHCIVETSPGKWHAYWLVSDCALGQFTPMQKTLAARFHGDPKVCDLPRVMRLPGFLHRKAQPFLTRLETMRDAPAYTMAELLAVFPMSSVTPSTVTPLRTVAHTRRTLPAIIPERQRNGTLLSLAGGLVNRGHDAATVEARLQRINAERCRPPLSRFEVATIVSQASAYGSNGWMELPHRLYDSPEWKSSSRSVHAIVLLAFRRFDGSNNGNIALTWADFEGHEGFSNSTRFYELRKAAVSAGFLIPGDEGRYSQSGRKSDLFAIAPRWIRTPAKVGNVPMRKGTKSTSYIDRQSLGVNAMEEGKAA